MQARGSVVGVFGVFAILLAAAAPVGAQQPDLRGVWTLDVAASDTLELAASDTAQQERRRFRVGVGGWAGGYPPQSRSIRDPRRMRDAVDAVSEPAQHIYIVQDDSTVTLSFDASPPLTLHTDGRKERRPWLEQHGVRVRVEWDDGELRIERKLESEVEIVDIYARAGDRLVISTVVEGPIPRRIELRRVYVTEARRP